MTIVQFDRPITMRTRPSVRAEKLPCRPHLAALDIVHVDDRIAEGASALAATHRRSYPAGPMRP